MQYPAFVQGNVVCFVAFNLVLRVFLTGVMNVAFVIHVFDMDLNDRAAYPASFRVPAHVIAHSKRPSHTPISNLKRSNPFPSHLEIAKLG